MNRFSAAAPSHRAAAMRKEDRQDEDETDADRKDALQLTEQQRQVRRRSFGRNGRDSADY